MSQSSGRQAMSAAPISVDAQSVGPAGIGDAAVATRAVETTRPDPSVAWIICRYAMTGLPDGSNASDA